MEKEKEKKVHLIYDDKNPNGRPETAQEAENRLLKESEVETKKLQEEQDKAEIKNMNDKVKSLTIPRTNMSPAPMRIFVLEVIPEIFLNKKLNLVMAQEFQGGNRDYEKKTKARYFCVAIGDTVKKQTFDGRVLEPGDEVMYMDIPDAIRVEIPEITDYELLDRTGEMCTYKLFDVMEIAGIVKK